MPEQIISSSGTQYGLIVNADGSINIGVSGGFSPTDKYMTVESDVVDTGSMYNCFEANDGSWYMMATFSSGGNVRLKQYRYIAGASNYIGSWANRTTLEFLTPGSAF